MTYFNWTAYIIIGLIVITLIDTIGAVASRKMNFKYAYLSILSFATYILLAYFVSKEYKLTIALFTNAIVGLYDGTVGFWLSIVLKANNGQSTEQASKMLGIKSAITMIIISIIFGIIGFGLLAI